MKKQKTISIFLAAVMCAAALSGCGDKGQDNGTQTGSKDQSGTVSSSSGAAAASEDFDGPSWKRDTTPVTVDWFVAYDWYGKVFDAVNNMADKKLLEETGITINIMTGDTEKLNALIVSGQLPDIVTFDAIAPQRQQMENAGMVMDLDELSEKFASDFQVPESMKDWYRNEDGKWYSAISYYYGPERCNDDFGGFLVTHNNNFVRTDLLTQLGMTVDDLKTKDGVFNALKTVKDKKLTYNGQEVLPITGISTRYWAQQFGVSLEDEQGNMLDERLQPEYLEALKFNNKMYNAGLFTNDEFTQETSIRDQKIASGRVFFAQGYLTVQTPRESLYASDPNAKLEYCGQIQGGDEGKTPYLVSSDAAGWTTTMITSKAKNPDRIISLFSYLSQENVILDEMYGSGAYDIVDGVVVQKPEIMEEYAQNYTAAYNKYNMNLGYLLDYTVCQKYENLNTEDWMDQDRIKQERDPEVNVYDDKCFYDVEPQAGTDLSSKNAAINEYWKTMEPQIIMAASEEACEKLYKETISKMEAMGLNDVNNFKNERFQENKAKLGIEHAWPSLQK